MILSQELRGDLLSVSVLIQCILSDMERIAAGVQDPTDKYVRMIQSIVCESSTLGQNTLEASVTSHPTDPCHLSDLRNWDSMDCVILDMVENDIPTIIRTVQVIRTGSSPHMTKAFVFSLPKCFVYIKSTSLLTPPPPPATFAGPPTLSRALHFISFEHEQTQVLGEYYQTWAVPLPHP